MTTKEPLSHSETLAVESFKRLSGAYPGFSDESIVGMVCAAALLEAAEQLGYVHDRVDDLRPSR